MQPPPLCGEPGWLEECDYVQLRKILRENGAVAAHELAHITSKIELISLCHTYGLGPTVPDEWTTQKNRARMQAEAAAGAAAAA